MKRFICFLIAMACCGLVVAAQKPRPRRAAKPAVANAQKPKFKAIFEPVNYDQDVELLSVYCADEKNCWAAGGTNEARGPVIIHTTDAGDHWTLEAGDPESDAYAFERLRFVDEHLGFALQRTGSNCNIYRTTDGEHWLPVGKTGRDSVDPYYFTSATSGVIAESDKIKLTQDDGQTWQTVATCAAKAHVNGLARNVGCQFKAMSFPTSSTGYVVAMSGEDHDNLFLAKTTDAGATWNILTLDVHNDGEGPKDIHFVDENTGFMRVGYGDTGKLYKTADGGNTWTAIAVSAGDFLRFSEDKRAGWAFHYSHLGFSADGGEHWSSRQLNFPASPENSSLPRGNFGMVVGDHGMIYRYRIVPVAYASKGMMSAPALTTTAGK